MTEQQQMSKKETSICLFVINTRGLINKTIDANKIRLFCKHQFNTLYIQPSKNNIEIVYLERKCFKCGKEIKKDQYVFQNPSGGVYKIGTFRKQMIICCTERGIHCNDYIFRPHDYRHTIASDLFDSGTSLQSIREFLGHKTEEMTKQYIDYVPNKIDMANEDYYSESDNVITAEISKKLNLKIRLKDLPNYDPEIDKTRKTKYGNRVYNFGKLKSDSLKREFKSFILYRSTQVSTKTLSTDLTYYNMLCKYIDEKNINSLLDCSWEEWKADFKKWLIKNGFSLFIKHSSPDRLKEYNNEHPAIGYFRNLYLFLQPDLRNASTTSGIAVRGTNLRYGTGKEQ